MSYEVTISANGKRIPRGKIVVDPDGVKTWETHVTESRHLFKAKDAWTVSETILTQLQELGVGRIRYIITDSNDEVYEVDMLKFMTLAAVLDQDGWKATTEEQYALPRRLWRKRGSRLEQLALPL